VDYFVDRFVRDRRLAYRHAIKTSLRFRIRKSSIPEQRAESENLSERGVYFSTSSPLSLGTAVDFLLKMPREITGREATEWRCTGHVVRLEPKVFPEKRLGVGVEFDFCEVCRVCRVPLGTRLRAASRPFRRGGLITCLG
jgi:Tfp pilus assembly protein PilZ